MRTAKGAASHFICSSCAWRTRSFAAGDAWLSTASRGRLRLYRASSESTSLRWWHHPPRNCFINRGGDVLFLGMLRDRVLLVKGDSTHIPTIVNELASLFLPRCLSLWNIVTHSLIMSFLRVFLRAASKNVLQTSSTYPGNVAWGVTSDRT